MKALCNKFDRRKDNSTLLVNGADFVLIDHELALGFDQLIGEPPPPWQLRGTELAKNHIFYIPLRAKITETSFDLFLERFALFLNYNSKRSLLLRRPNGKVID